MNFLTSTSFSKAESFSRSGAALRPLGLVESFFRVSKTAQNQTWNRQQFERAKAAVKEANRLRFGSSALPARKTPGNIIPVQPGCTVGG